MMRAPPSQRSRVGMACAAWIQRHATIAQTSLTPWKGFIFGILIGAIGQVGDLLESLMKRDAEVKDSGALIPGFA